MRDYVKDLYKKLSENVGQTPEAFHFDYFKLEGGELYYRGRNKPLTNGKGKLKSADEIAEILGKGRLRNLGFNIPSGKITPREFVALNKAQKELPSASDLAKADDTEMQEFSKRTMKSMEDLISQMESEQTQTDDSFKGITMRELLSLNE